MNTTLDLLESLVEERGLLYVANLLDHSDTSRIKRWIREQDIPSTQSSGIKAIIDKLGDYK